MENLFLKYLTEAPEDEAPEETPPDIPEEDTGPPDLDEPTGGPDDAPPDLDDNFDTGVDEGGFEEKPEQQDQGSSNNEINIDNLSDKVSAILNEQLYQRFLTLLTTIGNQISLLKNNNDVLLVVTEDIGKISESYNKLRENIRVYLTNNFMHENYSKNLLFYNKCLNLMVLLNKSSSSRVCQDHCCQSRDCFSS